MSGESTMDQSINNKEAMDRLDIELGFVGCYGYGAKYYAAMKLAEKAKKDGIVLGFKGSINSSLIAFLIGLTEINPLPKELGGFGLYDEVFYGIEGDIESCEKIQYLFTVSHTNGQLIHVMRLAYYETYYKSAEN